MTLENTEELQSEEQTESNGKHPPAIHSWDNAFKSMEGVNSLKYVVEAGENPLDLLMRSFIPSKKTDAYRTAVAFATALRKCREANDTDGENEFRDILALLPSMDGRSRDQLVSALIGYISEAKQGIQDFPGRVKNSFNKAFQQGQQ